MNPRDDHDTAGAFRMSKHAVDPALIRSGRAKSDAFYDDAIARWEADNAVIFGARWPEIREQAEFDMQSATHSLPSSDFVRLMGWQ